MNDYELLRQQKILRNEEKLRSLGLLPKNTKKSSKVQSESKHRAKQIHHSHHNIRNSITSIGHQRRRSARIRGIDPIPIGTMMHEDRVQKGRNRNNLTNNDTIQATEEISMVPIEIKTSVDDTITTNKTATKEHCMMRIRTMNEDQLLRRIRIIENARGKHCITKLQHMVQLCEENVQLHHLAQEANNAIKRLVNTNTKQG